VALQKEFQQAIDEIESASQEYCNGNASPFKALWSNSDDVTIMGAWGSAERSWDQVGPRLDWAAARFIEGKGAFETIAAGEDGNLGYTVWIERYDARVKGSDTVRPMALRVTQIYRWERDAWRIIHRHADAIMEKLEAPAILLP
jgi:ketosteroid isomerase-like protein